MKPPDLSTRQNGIVKAPSSPVFSRRNANPTGTLIFTAAGSQRLYQAPGSVTVLWLILQVEQAATIQILKNGEALSLPYNCNGGAVLHYCGMLLLGNESLNITSSAACSIDYEMAVVKEHDERLIVTDIRFWNTPSFVKKTFIETTTPLGAGGVFTGQWHDTELDGTIFLNVTSFADQASSGIAGALNIQASDDITNASLTVSISSSGSNPGIGANAIGRGFAVCKYRYWRVNYTNGAIAQTKFSLSVTASPFLLFPDNVSSNAWSNNGNTLPIIGATPFINAPSGASDSASNSIVQWTNPVAGQSTPIVYTMLCNGTTWDRPRNNVNAATGDTGAKVATFNGATQTNFDAVGAYITVLLGAVTGTTPTLTMQLQWSPDGGTTWLNLGPASAALTASSQNAVLGIYATNFSQTPGATPANLTTGATVSTFINAPLPRTWRIVYTIGGTTPSFTISSVQVNYIRG